MSHAISQLKKSIDAQSLSKIAQLLGEKEEGITNSMGGVFSVLLSSIVGKMESGGSAETLKQLIGLVDKAPSMDSLTSNPGQLFDLVKGEGALSAAAGQFTSLFLGDKTQALTGLVSKAYGLKPSSAGSLLSIAAPMVLSWISHRSKEDNLTPESFLPYLRSQWGFIEKAAPQGLSALLGLGGVAASGVAQASAAVESVSKEVTEVKEVIEEKIEEKRSMLMPILIVGALLLGAFFLWKSCAATKEELVTPVVITPAQPSIPSIPAVPEVANMAPDINADIWAHLGTFSAIKLPSGKELNIPEFGIERTLLAFIQDDSKAIDKTSWFSFDRLVFETASATLKAGSSEQLGNIAHILQAYPNVNLKLGGYTDNTGSADFNMKLSQDRANSVKQSLIDLGVAANRIEAEGYGEQFPVASNDTEEGRAQNRRIDLRVTQK